MRRGGVMFLTSLALASCVSLETAVPPVATLVAHGRNTATLEAGRRTYLGVCADCHTAQPVRDFSASQWPAIIADMSERSKLSPEEHRAVLAYVLAAAK